jgi:hypothetical protein
VLTDIQAEQLVAEQPLTVSREHLPHTG